MFGKLYYTFGQQNLVYQRQLFKSTGTLSTQSIGLYNIIYIVFMNSNNIIKIYRMPVESSKHYKLCTNYCYISF